MDLTPIGSSHPVEALVKSRALALGFDLVGIAPACPSEHREHLLGWLAAGRHADMAYMARDVERRLDIREHLPSARSVIMVAVSCFSQLSRSSDSAIFAMYALNEDYHDWMKTRLRELGSDLEALAGRTVAWKAFVDTAAVLERELAERAGLGWIGKNAMLINRRFGSHILLGGLVTDLELPVDQPAGGTCGRCRRCIEACPTGAIIAPRVVDARCCIAYHTIESRADIPRTIAEKMGRRIFGCDICQEVCPFNNARIPQTRHDAFRPRPSVTNRTLRDLAVLSDEDFRIQFRGSPVRRAKAAGLRRNALAALEAAPLSERTDPPNPSGKD